MKRAIAACHSIPSPLFVLAVAACAGPSTPLTPHPSPPATQASAPPASVAGKTTTLMVTAGGKQRPILVHTPGGARGAVALVLNLHGSGAIAADEEALSGMDASADANGFIVAYPQGDIALRGGAAWNIPGVPLSGGSAVPEGAADDVAFFRVAIAALRAAYPIDPKRIYVTGHSGGGRMASQLGCDLSTTIAAIAPVSGLRFPAPCRGDRPVPVITFHGTADSINAYEGGGQPYWSYGVRSAIEQWAAHDGCGEKPTTSHPEPRVEHVAYAGCGAGSAVERYTIEGEGHEWPGGPPQSAEVIAMLGAQSNAVDANAVMWAFFSAHPLP